MAFLYVLFLQIVIVVYHLIPGHTLLRVQKLKLCLKFGSRSNCRHYPINSVSVSTVFAFV